MLFKILLRTGGVLAFGLLILLRFYLVSHMFYPVRHYAPGADATYSPVPQVNYPNATIGAAGDTSAWVLFNSTDPQTGQRIRHARLTAVSGAVIDGHPAPPNVLELLEQGADGHRIRLTLQTPSACPGIATVHAVFGSRAATLAVKPVDHEAGCTVDLLDYAAIVQTLRDTDILTVSAGNGPDVRFEVAGLSWD